MADCEDDYMSDSFLVETKKTTKPGLLWGKHAHKKQQEAKHNAVNEQHRAKFKPVKEREQENRLKGLGSALSSQNKGFALLEKMGYKQGMGLGKKESGRSEPIPMEIKTGRGGLGRETEMKDQQKRKLQQYQQAMQHRAVWELEHRQDFRQRMSSKFSDKETEKNLDESQKACEHLERLQGLEEPLEPWYWPKQPATVQEEEEEEEEEDNEDNEDNEEEEEKEEPGSQIPAAEKLVHLTRYLRRHHRYCMWCGTSFNDNKDLADNCPGETADDHR